MSFTELLGPEGFIIFIKFATFGVIISSNIFFVVVFPLFNYSPLEIQITTYIR